MIGRVKMDEKTYNLDDYMKLLEKATTDEERVQAITKPFNEGVLKVKPEHKQTLALASSSNCGIDSRIRFAKILAEHYL